MENNSKHEMCPIRDIIARLSDKWSLLIIVTLSQSDKMRFSELLRAIGDVSQRMLTVTLRDLEEDGLISREVFPEVPPRVEYELTDLGRSLLQPLAELIDWAKKNTSTIQNSRKKYSKKRF